MGHPATGISSLLHSLIEFPLFDLLNESDDARDRYSETQLMEKTAQAKIGDLLCNEEHIPQRCDPKSVNVSESPINLTAEVDDANPTQSACKECANPAFESCSVCQDTFYPLSVDCMSCTELKNLAKSMKI